jgi:hypothetical protein
MPQLIEVREGRYFAQCPQCREWREVQVRVEYTEGWFVFLEARFTCCGTDQTVSSAIEKDELDFH